MTLPRIRQLVFAAHSLDVADELQRVLGLGEPYIDPGVGEFGLVNRVFAIGDQFLEVVVPVAETAPATRFLKRTGEGGYMAIFQVGDLNAARARADAMNIRRVWNIDLPDISASHLHPADIGGAIVSLDEPRPAPSWRWAGEGWSKRAAPGGLTGLTLTSPHPHALARKWAGVLGVEADGGRIALDGSVIDIVKGDAEQITAFHIASPKLAADITLGGVRLVAETQKA